MIVIGERVNATRKRIRAALEQKDAKAIQEEIMMQDAAGAHYIDLNAGSGSGGLAQEKEDLCWLIDLALECTSKKLALDAASPQVLKYAAKHLDGRRPWMLNSITGELDEASLAILELACRHRVPLIALAMDKEGIPPDAARRLAICEAIFKEAEKRGLAADLLYFDPLVMPLSTDAVQAMVTLQTIRGIGELFPEARTAMGLTNISHGLKKRFLINGAFLTTAICFGLSAVICDPTSKSVQRAIIMGNLLAGKDKFCRRYSRAVRSGLFEKGEQG